MTTAVHVWWSSLVAAERDLLDMLDVTERARVRSLERSADRGRSMVAAALLRVVVGEQLGVPPGDVVIDRTCVECGQPHGRPRVLGPGGAAPYVSVSHSGVLVVVALAAGAPVGVDVQRVADVAGADADDDQRAREWVRHEAAVKVGPGPARPAVRAIGAPLDGYVAALASLTDRAPTDAELAVRHWPERTRGAG